MTSIYALTWFFLFGLCCPIALMVCGALSGRWWLVGGSALLIPLLYAFAREIFS